MLGDRLIGPGKRLAVQEFAACQNHRMADDEMRLGHGMRRLHRQHPAADGGYRNMQRLHARPVTGVLGGENDIMPALDCRFRHNRQHRRYRGAAQNRHADISALHVNAPLYTVFPKPR
jgi:hypothetical protein